MKVTAVQCRSCGDTIYSRAGHDFRRCTCKAIFVDGGLNFFRSGGSLQQMSGPIELDVQATPKELYDDWNHGRDEFGLISEV